MLPCMSAGCEVAELKLGWQIKEKQATSARQIGRWFRVWFEKI